jgi:hypothetical protein
VRNVNCLTVHSVACAATAQCLPSFTVGEGALSGWQSCFTSRLAVWPTQFLYKLRLGQCIVTARSWRMSRHTETARFWRVARHIATGRFWRSRPCERGLQYSCQSHPPPHCHVAAAVTCQNHLSLCKLIHVFSHVEVFNVL